MKVGQIIFSKKFRPYEKATIIEHKLTKKEDGSVRSHYIARYLDGEKIKFYPTQVNKSIFLHMESDGQMTIWDYMGGKC